MSKRQAGFSISPRAVFDLLHLRDLFPDASQLEATYDWGTDMFKMKWVSEKFGTNPQGEPIPYIEVEFKDDNRGGVHPVSWNY